MGSVVICFCLVTTMPKQAPRRSSGHAYTHLTAGDRQYIDHALKDGRSISAIAQRLGKHRSTIYRELKRNAGKRSYAHKRAHDKATRRQARLQNYRGFTLEIRRRVREWLARLWSPEQIVGYARLHGIAMVSIQTIYTYIHQDRKAGGTLYGHCRHKARIRTRMAYATAHKFTDERTFITDMPCEWCSKEVFGIIEVDTIIGKNGHSAMLTLCERKTSFTMIYPLPEGKLAMPLAKTLVHALLPYKRSLKALIMDNGTEFTAFKYISRRLELPIYFARPYTSNDKPHIEHTNKLIRQYFAKGIPLDIFSAATIKQAQQSLNSRPRKKLHYQTPVQAFYKIMGIN